MIRSVDPKPQLSSRLIRYVMLYALGMIVGCQTPAQPNQVHHEPLIQAQQRHVIGDVFRKHVMKKVQTLPDAQRVDITLRLAKQACGAGDIEDGLAILQMISTQSPAFLRQRDVMKETICRVNLNQTIARAFTCHAPKGMCSTVKRQLITSQQQLLSRVRPEVIERIVLNPNIYDRTSQALKQLSASEEPETLARWLIHDLWSQQASAAVVQNMYKVVWHPKTRPRLSDAQHKQFLKRMRQLKDPSIKQTLLLSHTEQHLLLKQGDQALKLIKPHLKTLERQAKQSRQVARVLWSLYMAQQQWLAAEKMAALLDREQLSKNNQYSHQTFTGALNHANLVAAQTILDRMRGDDESLQRLMTLVITAHKLKQTTLANTLMQDVQKQHKATTADERLRWRLFQANIAFAAGREAEAEKSWKKLANSLEIARLSDDNTRTWNELINSLMAAKRYKMARIVLLQFVHAYVPMEGKRFKPVEIGRFITRETTHIKHPEVFYYLWQHTQGATRQRVFLYSITTKPIPIAQQVIQQILTRKHYSADIMKQAILFCDSPSCVKSMLKHSTELFQNSSAKGKYQQIVGYRLLTLLLEQSAKMNISPRHLHQWIKTLPTTERAYAWYKLLSLSEPSQYPTLKALEQLHEQTIARIDQTGARRLTKLILKHFVESNRCDLAWKHYTKHDIKPDTTSWSWRHCTTSKHQPAKIALIVNSAPTPYRQLRWLLSAFAQKMQPWSWQHIAKALKPISNGHD